MRRPVVGVIANAYRLENRFTTQLTGERNLRAVVDVAGALPLMFAGTPDQVFAQIKKHWDHVGGYGHLLIMGQAGFLDHDDTVHSIRMFAREVYPRLKDMYPGTMISGATEILNAAAS